MGFFRAPTRAGLYLLLCKALLWTATHLWETILTP